MRSHWLPLLPVCARTFCEMSDESRASTSSYSSAAATAPAAPSPPRRNSHQSVQMHLIQQASIAKRSESDRPSRAAYVPACCAAAAVVEDAMARGKRRREE